MAQANNQQNQKNPLVVCEQVHGPLGEGKTCIYGPVVPEDAAENIARSLQSDSPGCEAQYGQFHSINEKGGLVPLPCKIAFQGHISQNEEDGCPEMPWYRSPLTEVASNAERIFCDHWSWTIQMIKEVAEETTGFKWNTVEIIDWAQKSKDMPCGFHSENFKDLMPESPIGVVTLGAARELTMQKKDGIGHHQAVLRGNSLLVLDAETNALWNHTIKAMPEQEGPLISLVFRACWTKKSVDGLVYGPNCEFNTHQEAVQARDKKQMLAMMEQQNPKEEKQMGQQQQAQEEPQKDEEDSPDGQKMDGGLMTHPLEEQADGLDPACHLEGAPANASLLKAH